MKKLAVTFIIMLLSVYTFAADSDFQLIAEVKDAINKQPLSEAKLLLLDSEGIATDTIRTRTSYTYRAGRAETVAEFCVNVPRADSTYMFDVICDGYKLYSFNYTTKKIRKRELRREMPVIYLDRAPKMLNEVSVTTTKIKFYHKGDTIVYNADAFQLAEGSMLDALIAQLPGVELNNNGQIKVNGKFVESLLLNGKEFFGGDNRLMLDNIGAYTVKDIQVYEGQSRQARLMDDVTAPKLLTMDVRLKKEYNMGWLINGQAGYGTSDRYIARAFASWFNDNSRVSFTGNSNNLNDNRTPGKNDTWTPEMMPSGKKKYHSAGINYNFANGNDTFTADGNLTFNQTVNNNSTVSSRINFLPGGDTYDNAFGNSHFRQTNLNTRHSITRRIGRYAVGGTLLGSYNHTKNDASSLAGTFDREYEDMTAEILDAIYSAGTDEMLESIINRSKTRTDGWRRNLSGTVAPIFSFKITDTENMRIGVNANYTSAKEEIWRDYNINFGTDPVAADKRRQYIDNAPNHTLNLGGYAGYSLLVARGAYLYLTYNYSFTDNTKDSYMYALERLEDMGIYGTVPVGYLAALDPANSYSSRTIENRHSISPQFSYYKDFHEKGTLNMRIAPNLSLRHRHFDYWRNDRSYVLSTNNTLFSIDSSWDCNIYYMFDKHGPNKMFRHSLQYQYRINHTLPELVDMVDVVNDADPLNIYLGNPDLKSQTEHRHQIRWYYKPITQTFGNTFYISYGYTLNALTRGYTYDTATGVRHNRMYNVDGNHSASITNNFNIQFGSSKQFSFYSDTDATFAKSSDMNGVDSQQPELTKVRTNFILEKVKLGWQFAGQSIQLRFDYLNRHTSSARPGFNTLNANHYNYGISGLFKLPAGFGISTDFTCYTRRGYGVDYLDTTDPIWNVRATYCPPSHKRWVFMVDGFDLLHKLSNVNYAVTASGRTVSYTNALPRYVLFSVQYRLSIQPKRKINTVELL